MTGTRMRHSAALEARVALEAAKQTRTLAELARTFQVHPSRARQVVFGEESPDSFEMSRPHPRQWTRRTMLLNRTLSSRPSGARYLAYPNPPRFSRLLMMVIAMPSRRLAFVLCVALFAGCDRGAQVPTAPVAGSATTASTDRRDVNVSALIEQAVQNVQANLRGQRMRRTDHPPRADCGAGGRGTLVRFVRLCGSGQHPQ